jgi:LmbE family N-acetylglucosaminyl deacetylase
MPSNKEIPQIETANLLSKKAMVVVAHADDAEYSCSGTIAKLCSQKWDVAYVLCTNGSKGSSDNNMTSEEIAAIRRKEQIEAGQVLGLKDVAFLDYEDSALEPSLSLRKDIARQIRKYRPDILITTYPARNLNSNYGLGHPDHIAAGEAAIAAVFPTARDHLTFPELLEEGYQPHKVSEVWIIGAPDPDLWVDVSDHMETSIKALLKHSSQMSRADEETKEMMYSGRRERAEGKGMLYAETFKRVIIEKIS